MGWGREGYLVDGEFEVFGYISQRLKYFDSLALVEFSSLWKGDFLQKKVGGR